MRTAIILPMALLASSAIAEPVTPGTGKQTQPDAGATGQPTDGAPADSNEIVVIANRLRDQVEAPQPPLMTLDEADIASYGASSISDLVAALGPETNSGRGRGSGGPVILLNGQRISNFRELRNIPPEAIRRMEVLPEEVALRFGYPPNQRVINFILKPNFSSRTIDAQYGEPDQGGSSTGQLEATLLNINGPRRLNITVSADRSTPLTEAERNIAQTPGSVPTIAGDPDPAANRTLIPYNRDFGINGTWSTGLGDGGKAGSFSLNGSLSRNDTNSLSGLNGVQLTASDGTTAIRTFGAPLNRATRTTTVQGGAVLNKPLGSWQLTATVDGSHADSLSLIDGRADPSVLVAAAAAGTLAISGPLPSVSSGTVDRAHSVNDSLTSLVTLAGRPLSLPAGDVATTIKAGFAYTGINSSDSHANSGDVTLHRGDLSAGINVAVPLTSRRNTVLPGIGDITLNFSGGIDKLSDFGTLTDWSAGVTWGLTEKLSLQASYIDNQAAPLLGNLGNPLVTNLNVPVYDFTSGQTVLVTTLSGGYSALQRETQRDLKIGVNWQLPFLKNSNLIIEYFRNNSDNVTGSFPLLTPAMEAAFPGRVVRNAAGQLVTIDERPITIYREASSRLRYGVNLSGSIGTPSPSSGGFGGRGGGGRPGGGFGGRSGGGAGGAGGMAMMGRGGQGRWNFSVYHTVNFTNTALITPTGPALDLLSGDALSGGGVARQSVEMEGGLFYKGIGLRLNGNYNSPTDVRGSGLPGSSNLHFSGLATLNLRLFADLGQIKGLTDMSPFFKGMRISLRADNLFDARQKVTDENGVVPLSYQPDLVDPKGRFLGIELRKMF